MTMPSAYRGDVYGRWHGRTSDEAANVPYNIADQVDPVRSIGGVLGSGVAFLETMPVIWLLLAFGILGVMKMSFEIKTGAAFGK